MAVWDLNSNLDVFSMQTFLRGLIYGLISEEKTFKHFFQSAYDSLVLYRTTQRSFLQSHNSIGLVVSNKKIFKISTNQNSNLDVFGMQTFLRGLIYVG
jgi:hypothetical protein